VRIIAAAFPVCLLVQAGPSEPRFEATQPELLSAGGALVNAAADFDVDGDIDLFVGFNGAPNRLYRNDRGTLSDTAAAAGLADARPTRAAAWADVDGDRDPDLLVGFAPGAGPILRLYRNDSGRFADITTASRLVVDGGAVRQPAWVDFDGDRDLDLFVGFRDRPDALFRNDGGHFVEVAAEVGLADSRKTVGAVWFDFDQDGDLDLYAAHMDGDANGLYRNDKGRFIDVAAEAGVAWGGRTQGEPKHGTVRPCAEDVNNDGRIDLFMANYGPNGLFLNRGGGKFEDVSASWSISIDARYDTCAFADLDHDGRLDLYVNGTVTGGVTYRDYLFRNTGSGFTDVTPETLRTLAADHGALWNDFDGDGDPDLALTGSMHLIFRNLLPAAATARAIHVTVADTRGRRRFAGAEVRVYDAPGKRLIATRLVDSGSSYNAQSDAPLHVGVGSAARVDVEVTWPSGSTRRVTRVLNIDTARQKRRPVVIVLK
jgi:hypothetical protein